MKNTEKNSELLVKDLIEVFKETGNLQTTFKDIDLQQKYAAGNTLLHWAIANNADITLIEYLIKNGIDVNQANHCGATPLHWAVDHHYLSAMNLLLDKGANIDSVDNEKNTALHWAMNENEDPIIILLIERGADLKKENNDKETLFNWAASLRKEGILKLILDKEKPLKPEKSESNFFKLFTSCCFFSCSKNASADNNKNDHFQLKTKSLPHGASK